ncbi:MAG: agmatine deiminase family protein [Pseudomonadota bacterium]
MKRRDVLRQGAALTMASLANPGFGSVTPPQPHGFRVPPEEAPHARTFMQWPNSRRVYASRWFLKEVQHTIANVANAISEFEPVTMMAHARSHDSARNALSKAVELWDIPTEDLWCRDSGPIFAVNDDGQIAVTHIQFNGWGRRQLARYDSEIARLVAERLDIPLLPSGLVGEGGGVEQDGHGLLLAHESSWVHVNRNRGLSRNDIEARLLTAYSAERMIWAPGLRDEDITDYHIDSLARFTGPGRVLMNLPETPDPSDPFHTTALETREILVNAGIDVEVIPESHVRRVRSPDFVASYVNYYVCNGAVIAAQFGDAETDEIAAEALKRHYPGREIVMLDVDRLGELGGGIHCATQQVPAA